MPAFRTRVSWRILWTCTDLPRIVPAEQIPSSQRLAIYTVALRLSIYGQSLHTVYQSTVDQAFAVRTLMKCDEWIWVFRLGVYHARRTSSVPDIKLQTLISQPQIKVVEAHFPIVGQALLETLAAVDPKPQTLAGWGCTTQGAPPLSTWQG